MSFGLRLNLARSLRKMSVNDLAYKSGVCRTTIYNLENGTQKMPNCDTVIKICKVLDVTSDYLLELED